MKSFSSKRGAVVYTDFVSFMAHLVCFMSDKNGSTHSNNKNSSIRKKDHYMNKPVHLKTGISVFYSKFRLAVQAVCVFALMLFFSSCARYHALSEKPDRFSQPSTFDTKPSTIAAQVTVPISQIASAINSNIPPSFEENGNGPDFTIKMNEFTKYNVGTHYDITVSRSGDIQLSVSASNVLHLTTIMNINGWAGLRGDGARALGLHKKNVKGSMRLEIDLSVDLTTDWCPNVDLNIGYRWNENPKIEIFKNAWVDIQRPVEERLNNELPGLLTQAKSAVDCKSFKDKVAALYGSQSFPIKLPDGSEVYANLEPTGIGFSGLQINPAVMTCSALLTAGIDVSATPITPTLRNLPPLTRIPPTVPRMNIALPIRAPYSILTKLLREAVVGQTFSSETAAGKVSILVKNIELYPSGDHLVIGVDLKASLPGRILDTSGAVYVLAIPTVENGTLVRLADPGFTRKLDNEFWNVATVVLEGQILKALKEAAVYDLTGDISKLKESLLQKLKDPATTPGIEVLLDNINIGLGRVGVSQEEFAVEVKFAADTRIKAKP